MMSRSFLRFARLPRLPRLARIASAIAGLGLLGALAATACSQGSEGDRCNPNLAAGESECNGGLTCGSPPLCPEAYCCPTLADGGLAPSRNPFCQPGCNGGAASICNSGQDDAGACAFACKNDPGDLTSTAVCQAPVASDAGLAPDASDAGDAGADGAKPADAGPG